MGGRDGLVVAAGLVAIVGRRLREGGGGHEEGQWLICTVQGNYTVGMSTLSVVRRSPPPRKHKRVQDLLVLAALVRPDRLPIVRDIIHPEPSVKAARSVKRRPRQRHGTYPTFPYPE